MILNYKDLEINILYDELYSYGSADNIRSYDFIYASHDDYLRTPYSPKYGVLVKKGDKVLKSAILIAGSTASSTPDERKAIIRNDNLIIILGNSVFSVCLPDLSLDWFVLCEESATCFQLFPVHGGYIIHGELSIFRINDNGKIVWDFFGRDIFVTPDGDDFSICGNVIFVKDWDHNEYRIDIETGTEIKTDNLQFG